MNEIQYFLGDGVKTHWTFDRPITAIIELRTRGYNTARIISEREIEITPPLLFNVEAELEYAGKEA